MKYSSKIISNNLRTFLFYFSYEIPNFSTYSDEPTGRLALVFELMDQNMYEAIKGRRHYLPE